MPSSVDNVAKTSASHTLCFKGCVIPYTNGIEDRRIEKYEDDGQHHVYVVAWANGGLSTCAHVQFNQTDGRDMGGDFEFSLPFSDGDPDALKIQVCTRMRDEESDNRRTVELYMGYANMNKMLKGQEDCFGLRNQFVETKTARISISIKNAKSFRNHMSLRNNPAKPLLQLKRSAVFDVPRVNKDMEAVSKYVDGVLGRNQAKMPPGGDGFRDGITSRPFGGRMKLDMSTEETPPLSTHHALLGAGQEGVDRTLPPALVLYHMYLKTVHSGLTGEQVLALDGYSFGTFFAEAHQFTCCAGLFPYEKDFVPAFTLSWENGVGFYACGTEDLGWPCTDATFAGRTMRDMRPIKVRTDMSMKDLAGLFHQEAMDRTSFRSLHPALSFVPKVPVSSGALPELLLHPHTDDCESSALFAQLLKKTSMAMFVEMEKESGMQGKGRRLRAMCDGWHVFRNFTETSWTLMASVMDRGCKMLQSKELVIVTGVGLATNASAEQVRSGSDVVDYCGHCFNVSRIQTASMPQAKFGLLEGTAPMFMVSVGPKSPSATVSMTQVVDGQPCTTTKQLKMPSFLSLLGSTVLRTTQVINSPKGGDARGLQGWPLDVKVTGWRSRTMVTAALDSDKSADLEFYNRIMFFGWPCKNDGQGCMPMDERKCVVAGCHPFQLNDMGSRAVSAGLPSLDSVRVMQEVMEETTPPMAPTSILRDLASKWLPCRPFEAINMDAVREPGVKYHRICTMESPCAPEYLSILFEIKRRIADETNRLNAAAPDSDGIRAYALLEGLSAILALDVPDRDISRLTVVHSMKQAIKNLGCPQHEEQK